MQEKLEKCIVSGTLMHCFINKTTFLLGVFSALVVVPNPNIRGNLSNYIPINSNQLHKTPFLLTQDKNEPLF